ncbi:HPr family phosphocarrier protein [Xylanimonas oleitrophica]|uniref:Phosphocarrier protein HPr n=1 Tax=Xylanimonas oleitrophica TaxID=2607479 RepID=A0A2W5YFS5_9MICO|nr:HPr family phosphocarrier protein [Xylanimonas oleitrophica]PZR53451.1 HPr family phosphocarrier protein [Xylanimonas oleitrophica]
MERVTVVGIREGLHARPAALFVQEASRQPVPVRIGRPGGEQVEAASILGVMTLAAAAGDEVVLSTAVDGPEAEAAIEALAAFLAQETPA